MYKKALSIIGIGFIGVILIVALVSWLLGTVMVLSDNPPSPKQTSGEFPYKLVYSIDGHEYTQEGVYVCEYVGISMDTASGKYRDWKGYVKGTDNPCPVLYRYENIEVYCDIGEPSYYMNDTEHPRYKYIVMPVEPHLYLSSGAMPESVIKSQYKIEILEWTFSDPISMATM